MGIETNQDTSEFEAFANAGEVEVGKPAGADTGGAPVDDDKKGGGSGKAPKTAPAKEAPKAPAADEDDDNGVNEEDDDENEEDDEKPKRANRESQIDRLKRERAAAQREARELRQRLEGDLARRLENLEKGLQGGNTGDTKTAAKAAPDPTDTAKYPLGHLDDRYIEDKLEWLADQKATKQADAVLHRQQELERNADISRQQSDILTKVEGLSAKGSELFDDFQESVVESGMRGDWDLAQPTFEAAHEADNGAQILYNLSQDPKEASRVAKLSPYQQLKYVQEKDAELSNGKRGRTKPQAGEPPRNTARGANSRTHISPATDNLDDFEKAWERDAKGSR